MSQSVAVDLLQQALWVTVLVSSPTVITTMVVGFVISLFQALTQVQEVTLTFVPKMMLGFLVMAMTANFAGNQLSTFMTEVYSHIERGSQ